MEWESTEAGRDGNNEVDIDLYYCGDSCQEVRDHGVVLWRVGGGGDCTTLDVNIGTVCYYDMTAIWMLHFHPA